MEVFTMAKVGRLSEKILSCLERNQRELVEKQKLIDESMNELLEQRERFATFARRIIESVIHPLLEEVTLHFDNATVTEYHGNNDFHCICKFAHTPRFPASVSLDFYLLPAKSNTELTARYDLEIRPAMMEYKRNEEKNFPLDDADEAIGLWVEEKVVECVDTYLRLETHPLYQKENMVIDPVCGMQISSVAAKCKIERPHRRTIYFCSEACKEAFLKGDTLKFEQ
jgi:YHS domain-containing protein